MITTGFRQIFMIGFFSVITIFEANASKGIVLGMVIDTRNHPAESASVVTSDCRCDVSAPGILLYTEGSPAIDATSDSTASRVKKIEMTTLAFGGTGVLFTMVNNQPGVMTGGRGSATFNSRYTFGGGGWGMPGGTLIRSISDTLELFKMGYGGLEFGYLFFDGANVRFGSNLMAGFGIGFQETYPRSKGEVKMFPVFEPSIYAQIALGEMMKLDIGVTWRFVPGSHFTFIAPGQLSGPSVYLALLAGTCSCKKK